MATEIRGGSNQVGTSNTQFIESTVTTINNNFTININVNCTECHQHQRLDGVSVSQGKIHHVIECLQKIATSGDQLAQPKAEAAIKSQIEPATQEQQQVVKKKKRKRTGPRQQTSSPEKKKGTIPGQGDIVLNQGSSIFVGDGHVIRYDRSSNTVVKEKLQMGRCIVKGNPLSDGNLRELPLEERIQRALQQVSSLSSFGFGVVDWKETISNARD